MRPRPTIARVGAAVMILALGWTSVPAGAQDPSSRPIGPPTATPLAEPPTVPAGDGTGVRLHTALGDIVIGLFTESSPVAAENFRNLASADFYDGTVFHRIMPGFVIQGGDPTGTGSGDAGYSIVDEPVVGQYGRGIVAMARTPAPDSQGSQFFIVLDDEARASLDAARTYAIFGRVVEGMDVADAIAAGPSSGPPDDRALEPVTIESTSIEQVVLPPEPTPPASETDDELARIVAVTVAGRVLEAYTITGDGLRRVYGADDPITTGLQAIAEGVGATLQDASIVVAGVDLPNGQPLDISGLRVRGADGTALVAPFASLITGGEDLMVTPTTHAGRDVLELTGAGQDVAITGYVNEDHVLLIRTADGAARDEVLAQLP